MKKWIAAICAWSLVLMLTGCGTSFRPAVSSLYIQKDGKISEAIVESFEKDYYSLAEFQAMIGTEIERYNINYGEERISIDRLEVDEDDTLYLIINYKDADTYEHYNEVYCFFGTIEEALAEGLSFNMVFKDAAYEEYSTSDVTADKSRHVLVVRDEGIVQLEKPIQYVSNNVEVISDRMVQVMPIEDSSEYAYIIF